MREIATEFVHSVEQQSACPFQDIIFGRDYWYSTTFSKEKSCLSWSNAELWSWEQSLAEHVPKTQNVAGGGSKVDTTEWNSPFFLFWFPMKSQERYMSLYRREMHGYSSSINYII